jgi:hypothetical protein
MSKEPSSERVKRIVESLPDPNPGHSLDECAAALLEWISAIDPVYAQGIKIMREERGFEPKFLAAALIAYPLEHSLYMELPRNPTIEQAIGGKKLGASEMTCLMCGTVFKPMYAGSRPLCSNRCANGYDAGQKAEHAA